MRFVKAAALLLLVLCAFAAPAHAEVAVVDVVQVIDSSVPGKAGQKYVDNLKSQLDAEFESYKRSVAKDKDAQAKTAQKQASSPRSSAPNMPASPTWSRRNCGKSSRTT